MGFREAIGERSHQIDHCLLGKRSFETERAADCAGKSSIVAGEISQEKVETTNTL